jgi:ATP-dependent RNA helicase DDX47/RRP3
MLLQYDVELYQRIEHLIGKKLPLYKTEEEEVMVLQERVSEAQRAAKMVSYFQAFEDSFFLLMV